MIQKYRKKPVVIEAIQYTGDNIKDIVNFTNNEVIVNSDKNYTVFLEIRTLEGNMTISLNDYIIKGVNGEFYPCKPDIFEKTYEEVN